MPLLLAVAHSRVGMELRPQAERVVHQAAASGVPALPARAAVAVAQVDVPALPSPSPRTT